MPLFYTPCKHIPVCEVMLSEDRHILLRLKQAGKQVVEDVSLDHFLYASTVLVHQFEGKEVEIFTPENRFKIATAYLDDANTLWLRFKKAGAQIYELLTRDQFLESIFRLIEQSA